MTSQCTQIEPFPEEWRMLGGGLCPPRFYLTIALLIVIPWVAKMSWYLHRAFFPVRPLYIHDHPCLKNSFIIGNQYWTISIPISTDSSSLSILAIMRGKNQRLKYVTNDYFSDESGKKNAPSYKRISDRFTKPSAGLKLRWISRKEILKFQTSFG